MGRKKKNSDNTKENGEKNGKFKLGIGGDTKRSVAAIFLFALAILVILGFFNKAGVVGELLDEAGGVAIGWTKFALPLFLVVAGIVLLLRKETSFYVSKLTGLAMALISLAGFLHWFFDINTMKEAAAAGSGGGYIGFAVAYGAVKYLEKAGGLVVILALFAIGVVVSLDFPVVSLIHKLRELQETKKDEELEGSEEEMIVAPNENDEIQSPSEEESAAEEIGKNIGNIEFVEGADRYVDAKLLEKLSSGVDSIKKKFSRRALKSKAPEYPLAEGEWQLPPIDLLERSHDNSDPGDKEKKRRYYNPKTQGFRDRS